MKLHQQPTLTPRRRGSEKSAVCYSVFSLGLGDPGEELVEGGSEDLRKRKSRRRRSGRSSRQSVSVRMTDAPEEGGARGSGTKIHGLLEEVCDLEEME